MQINKIVEILEAKMIVGEEQADIDVRYAFGSDLMSDVLAYAVEDSNHSVLLTGLINNQVIRTAEMLDLRAVVFVRGKKPTDEVIELARENNLVLICTAKTMYESAGMLYSNGLQGIPG